MGVFQNTYVPNYEKMVEILEKQKVIEDQNFFVIYMSTVINTFNWKNLPPKMPKFNMETYLQTAGVVAAFMDGDEFKILPAFPNGSLTEYGEFDQYIAINALGKPYILKKDEIELCYNSSLKIPYVGLVKGFAENTSRVLRYTYAALRRASKPPIIGCENESQMKTLDSLRGEITDVKDFVSFYGEGVMDSSVKRIPLFDNRENDVIAMWDIYTRQRNLFYTTFGINNVEIQKRERLTEAEGSGNDEIVRYSLLDDMFENRRDFIDRVQKKFNKTLELEINRDPATVWTLNQSNKKLIEMYEIAMTKGANPGIYGGSNDQNGGVEVDESTPE